MNTKVKRTALLGMVTSVALVLAYLEAILPPVSTAVPGIKMGLPNLAIIFVLYRFGFKDAAVVSALRLFIVALLFGNVMTLAYSTAGAVLSLTLMGILKKTDKFSTVGVSVTGAVMHNLGQILVAVFLFETVQLGYYMIILSVTGSIAGVLIGISAGILLRRTEKLKI
ncbi:MAG: Gx transporter family protein [Clostridia bacterium]|nr:Gx transporter family protein [Clostridia bacterium]